MLNYIRYGCYLQSQATGYLPTCLPSEYYSSIQLSSVQVPLSVQAHDLLGSFERKSTDDCLSIFLRVFLSPPSSLMILLDKRRHQQVLLYSLTRKNLNWYSLQLIPCMLCNICLLEKLSLWMDSGGDAAVLMFADVVIACCLLDG